MSKKWVFKFEQGGRTIVTSSTDSPTDFKVVSGTPKGLSAAPYDNQMTINPQVPGGRINNTHIEPRPVELSIACPASYRDFITRFFLPGTDGKLTVTVNDKMRWAGYKVSRFELYQSTIYANSVVAEISLVCEDPYLYDMDDFGKDIAEVTNLIGFDFGFFEEIGIVTDYKTSTTATMLYNQGDFAIPLKFVFIARGDVRNPKVTLENGDYMRVIVDMVNGDVLEMIPSEPKILLNGENIIHKMDKTSKFLMLEQGSTKLEYSTDLGQEFVEVRLYFTPAYAGV